MLSRVADAIHWMCRYVERADNVARFIQVNHDFNLDNRAGMSEQWAPLISIMADEEVFKKKYGEHPTKQDVISFLVCDTDYYGSIMSCLRAARENGRSIRDTLSSDVWEHLNRFYLFAQEATARGAEAIAENPDLLAEIKWHSHLFFGCFDKTMSHGEAWQFGRLGELLERADKTSRILDVKYFHLLPSPRDVGGPLDDSQWTAILRSVSGLEMYRQRHRRISPEKAVQFLVFDREFPRAILFCVNHADHALRAISGIPGGSFSNPAEQQLGQLNAHLSYTNARQVLRSGLHEFLDQTQTRLNAVGEAMFKIYFSGQVDAEPDSEPEHA
jgi:uncharacterized alpha-E superfamily protein